MQPVLTLGERKVGDGSPVFVVAEVGINHNGSMEKARRLIDEAVSAGASAVKLQTYITEKRVAADSPIFGILKQCELSFDQQRELFSYAREKKMMLFSTPFDEESVTFLEEMDVPCYKVASFDIVNSSLLESVASKKRPVIVSRGMASKEDIDGAVAILQKHQTPFALLHCISAYPVPSPADLHLRTIQALKERYNCPVGYSDHSAGIDASTIAVAAGASIIEKHFMLADDNDAPDRPVSLTPKEFRAMTDRITEVSTILGDPLWGSVEAEKGILQFRRPT